MSASSIEAPPTMPTMVSRLPKFGFQSKSVTSSSSAHTGLPTSADMTSTRLTNGFYHHPGPVGVNSSGAGSAPSAKQNGFLRVPVSFAVKSEQEPGGDEKTEVKRGSVCQNRFTNNRQVPSVTTTAKGRVFNQPVTLSSSRSPQSVSKIPPLSKGSSKLGQSALNLANGTKQAPNGPLASKPWTGQSGSLRRPQSFAHPGVSRSPLHKKQASRSHSSDDLGFAPSIHLTQSDRIRSQSLNQVQRQASPTLSPSPNRSRLKPVSSSHGSAQGISTIGRQTPEEGSWGTSGSSIPSLLSPCFLKKSLLPTIGPASKNSGVSYKLSRPSLNKQLRPLRATPARVSKGEQEVNKMMSAKTPPTTGNSQSGLFVVKRTLKDAL